MPALSEASLPNRALGSRIFETTWCPQNLVALREAIAPAREGFVCLATVVSTRVTVKPFAGAVALQETVYG